MATWTSHAVEDLGAAEAVQPRVAPGRSIAQARVTLKLA